MVKPSFLNYKNPKKGLGRSFYDVSHKFKFISNLFMEQIISLVQRSVPFFQWGSKFKRHREMETQRTREMSTLKKIGRKNESKIKSLEAEKRMKELALKRKSEEVSLLRKAQRRVSQMRPNSKKVYNLGVKIRNLKVDFKTGGTWRWVINTDNESL